MYMLIPAMAQQRRDYWTVARLKPIYNLAVLGLISILLIYGMALDIGAIYKVYILVGLVLGLWSIMVTYRGQVFEKTSMKHVRSYLAASSVLLVSTALTMVGNRLDVFFLGHYLNFEQLGVYGVALRISIIISVMTAVMSIVMIPRATEAAADSEKFKRYMALGGFYAGIQLVFGVILLLLVGPLIHVMFGAEYSHAVLPASILIGQVLATSIGIPFQSLLQCGGRPSRMVYIALIRIILTVPLLQWLIPRYAVVGAALAVTTTTLLLTVIMMFLAIKHRPVLQG